MIEPAPQAPGEEQSTFFVIVHVQIVVYRLGAGALHAVFLQLQLTRVRYLGHASGLQWCVHQYVPWRVQ